MVIAEAAKIESWKLRCFIEEQKFTPEQAELLLAWRVDPHDSHKLLFRDGERTECRHETALRILTP